MSRSESHGCIILIRAYNQNTIYYEDRRYENSFIKWFYNIEDHPKWFDFFFSLVPQTRQEVFIQDYTQILFPRWTSY